MAERNLIGAVPTASEPPEIVVPLTGSKYNSLRYNAAILEGIRRHAVNKFQSIPRGGLEVGGLLIGRVAGDLIEINDSIEFTIEYASGPSYCFAPGDETALRERLQSVDDVVGWWHSHTRSEAELSEEDLRVHREFFPADHAIALILKPFKFDPAQAVVFVPNSAADPYLACGRFELDAPDARPRPVMPPAQAPASSAEPSPLTPVVVPLPVRPVRRRRRVQLLALIAAGAGVAVLFGASWIVSRPSPVAAPVTPLALTLSDSANHLSVQWNRDANAIRTSVGGELTVLDGPHVTRIPLGIDSLITGTLSYIRRSGRVEVRLRTTSTDNQLHEAVAHFIGPEPEPVTVTRREEPPHEGPDIKRMREEMERLNTELARMRSTPKAAPPPSSPSTVRDSAARTMTPIAPAPQPQQQAQAQALPVSVTPPPLTTLQSTSQAPVLPTAPSTLPQTLVAPPPAAPKQLARGRAIWTGALPRGSVLSLDGRRPSAGALTGRMPDGPSRMRIYSADLRESGIVVYTESGKERIERPSAANGWNLTTYRPDNKRARDITVLESPSAANNWQRIMVRSEQRPLSMLVLEWEEHR